MRTSFKSENNEETIFVKQLFLTLLVAVTAVSAFAQNNVVVRWN
jgi:hypothetical protein